MGSESESSNGFLQGPDLEETMDPILEETMDPDLEATMDPDIKENYGSRSG